MGFLELFLIGVGLSMDAFAVAICQGLSMTKIKWGHALTVGCGFDEVGVLDGDVNDRNGHDDEQCVI